MPPADDQMQRFCHVCGRAMTVWEEIPLFGDGRTFRAVCDSCGEVEEF